jgi:hypothetical protein
VLLLPLDLLLPPLAIEQEDRLLRCSILGPCVDLAFALELDLDLDLDLDLERDSVLGWVPAGGAEETMLALELLLLVLLDFLPDRLLLLGMRCWSASTSVLAEFRSALWLLVRPRRCVTSADSTYPTLLPENSTTACTPLEQRFLGRVRSVRKRTSPRRIDT